MHITLPIGYKLQNFLKATKSWKFDRVAEGLPVFLKAITLYYEVSDLVKASHSWENLLDLLNFHFSGLIHQIPDAY